MEVSNRHVMIGKEAAKKKLFGKKPRLEERWFRKGDLEQIQMLRRLANQIRSKDDEIHQMGKNTMHWMDERNNLHDKMRTLEDLRWLGLPTM